MKNRSHPETSRNCEASTVRTGSRASCHSKTATSNGCYAATPLQLNIHTLHGACGTSLHGTWIHPTWQTIL